MPNPGVVPGNVISILFSVDLLSTSSILLLSLYFCCWISHFVAILDSFSPAVWNVPRIKRSTLSIQGRDNGNISHKGPSAANTGTFYYNHKIISFFSHILIPFSFMFYNGLCANSNMWWRFSQSNQFPILLLSFILLTIPLSALFLLYINAVAPGIPDVWNRQWKA